MKNQTTYIELKAGDVRQKGDEQRCCLARQAKRSGFPPDWETERFGGCFVGKTEAWKPATLLGHAILQSDLIHLEFRRAVHVNAD